MPRPAWRTSSTPCIGVEDERGIFGGCVEHAHAATKAISHPLWNAAAEAPEGWPHEMTHAVRDVVLPGFTAFNAEDALAAGRSLLAGLLFGCLAYKPQVFVLAPICLLACRDLRALIGLAITGLGLPLAGLVAFGLDIWLKFIEHLPEQMSYVTSGRMPRERFATVCRQAVTATEKVTVPPAKAV